MSSRLITTIQAVLLFVALALSTYVALEAFKPRRPVSAVRPPAAFQGRIGRGDGIEDFFDNKPRDFIEKRRAFLLQ